MDLFLAALAATVLAGYLVSRLREHLALSRLPPMADLFELPLPALYRKVVYAERARLRRHRQASTIPLGLSRLGCLANDVMKLLCTRVLGIKRTRSWLGLRVQQTFARAMVGIDRVVDNDCPPTAGSRQSFFAHVTSLIEGLADPSTLTETALAEDLAVIYTVRATKQLLGFDPVSALQRIWKGYTPDALRILADVPVTDQATLELAYAAYWELQYLAGIVMGLSEDRARLLADLDVPSSLVHDTLVDLQRDAHQNQFGISREELAEFGLSAAEMHAHSSSREDLATVPGLAHWYVTQAARHGTQWREDLLPRLKAEVAPYVEPWLARKWLLGIIDSRAQSYDRCLAWWQDRLPKPAPTQPPPGWLALADFYQAAATSFGLSVSQSTMLAWRRVSAAAFWLDHLLDESPDRDRAKEIFERLITGPQAPRAAELPGWVGGGVLDAIKLLKQSVSSLSSSPRIWALALAIGDFAAKKAAANNVLTYVRLLRQEDAMNGWLEADCMTDAERAHPAFPQFRRWCGKFFTACGVFDALIDLDVDYRKHRVSVRPTIWAKLVLGTYFLWVSACFIARYPRAFIALARSIDERRSARAEAHRREEVKS